MTTNQGVNSPVKTIILCPTEVSKLTTQEICVLCNVYIKHVTEHIIRRDLITNLNPNIKRTIISLESVIRNNFDDIMLALVPVNTRTVLNVVFL